MIRIKDHLFLRAGFMILIEIKEGDIISDIAKRTTLAQCHTQKIITEMVKHKLLNKVKQDRRRILTLTKKGKEIQDASRKLYFMTKEILTEKGRKKNEIINR